MMKKNSDSFIGISADEIKSINKIHGDSNTVTGEVDTVLANMSYRT